MSLMINVGLSRKASENFQSTGTSINITAELDQSLLGRPNQLQEEIDHLFGQASDALDRQSDRLQAETDKLGSTSTHGRDGRPNGSDSGHTNTNGQAAVPITQAQSRAITAITRRLGIDAASECHNAFGWDLAKLSIRQASEFIDHLNGLQPVGSKSP